MTYPKFSFLRERLLEAGIAPGRVNRLIVELREHYEDLVESQRAAGVDAEGAHLRALERLGEESVLASSVLQRLPGRTLTSRAPWTVFIMIPTALQLVILICAALTMMHVLWPVRALTLSEMPDRYRLYIEVADLFVNYVVWIALSAGCIMLALRHRANPIWVGIGLSLLTAISALIGFHVHIISGDGLNKGRVLYSAVNVMYSHGRPDMATTYAAAAIRTLLETVVAVGIYRLLWARRTHQ